MLPRWHILIGGIISFFIWIIFPEIGNYIWIVFLSSFLIDIDHYFVYAIMKKDVNPIHSIRYYFRRRKFFKSIPKKEWKKYKAHYLIFQTLELWIVFGLLGFLHPIFWFILLGIGIHMVLDYIALVYEKIFMWSKISLIVNYFVNQKKIELKNDSKLCKF